MAVTNGDVHAMEIKTAADGLGIPSAAGCRQMAQRQSLAKISQPAIVIATKQEARLACRRIKRQVLAASHQHSRIVRNSAEIGPHQGSLCRNCLPHEAVKLQTKSHENAINFSLSQQFDRVADG